MVTNGNGYGNGPHEDEVYFTAMKHGPSTINFAEQIIQAICEVESIDWRTTTFYDVQTVWGFPASHRRLEDFCIDRLVVEDKGYPLTSRHGTMSLSRKAGTAYPMFKMTCRTQFPHG